MIKSCKIWGRTKSIYKNRKTLQSLPLKRQSKTGLSCAGFTKNPCGSFFFFFFFRHQTVSVLVGQYKKNRPCWSSMTPTRVLQDNSSFSLVQKYPKMKCYKIPPCRSQSGIWSTQCIYQTIKSSTKNEKWTKSRLFSKELLAHSTIFFHLIACQHILVSCGCVQQNIIIIGLFFVFFSVTSM